MSLPQIVLTGVVDTYMCFSQTVSHQQLPRHSFGKRLVCNLKNAKLCLYGFSRVIIHMFRFCDMFDNNSMNNQAASDYVVF